METIKDASIGDIVELTSISGHMIYVGKDASLYYFKPVVDNNYDRYYYKEFEGQQCWHWSLSTIENLSGFKIIKKEPVINEQEVFDNVFKLLTKVIKSI